MRTFIDALVFATGFGACWYAKDVIVRVVAGTEGLVRSLEAWFAHLKAKL